MRVVSRFEANLLRILHFFLKRVPAEQALPLVGERLPQPKCLSRAAVELVQDSLAKGCPFLLAHAGGWRRERFLRGEGVREGRLWQRTAPGELALSFSRNTMRFLLWITGSKPNEDKTDWHRDGELTVGDQLLLTFAYEALRGSRQAGALCQRLPFSRIGLIWLAHPEDVSYFEKGECRLGEWTTGVGACILEALQPLLADRWLALEEAKRRVSEWQAMQRLGQAQARTLETFLNAIDEAGRHDLARFLLPAAAAVLPENASALFWVGGLGNPPVLGPRMADRSETARAALALLHALDRLRQWEREARGVGYFDEGYEAAQLWKADWERWQGDSLHARAQAVIRQLDPMRQTTT
jgi:hypothetical protein